MDYVSKNERGEESEGFYTDRADDRHRDYRYPGGNRHPAV